MAEPADYNKLLSVGRSATPAITACRRRARRHHHDKNQNNVRELTELFQQLQNAMQALSTPWHPRQGGRGEAEWQGGAKGPAERVKSTKMKRRELFFEKLERRKKFLEEFRKNEAERLKEEEERKERQARQAWEVGESQDPLTRLTQELFMDAV